MLMQRREGRVIGTTRCWLLRSTSSNAHSITHTLTAPLPAAAAAAAAAGAGAGGGTMACGMSRVATPPAPSSSTPVYSADACTLSGQHTTTASSTCNCSKAVCSGGGGEWRRVLYTMRSVRRVVSVRLAAALNLPSVTKQPHNLGNEENLVPPKQ